MREELLVLCREFIQNRDIVKANFSWENSYFYPIAAAIFSEKGKPADADRMKECRALLKENTGTFSDFRGNAQVVTFALLAADEDPKERLRKALTLFQAFRTHFWSSQYLPIAALMLSEPVPETQYDALAERARTIYERMKKEHPFLTSSEDSVFAAMLALSKERDSDVITETERCYRLLKEGFHDSNAVQSLSHVLALAEGRADEKCERVLSIYRALKEKKYRYGTGYELPTLGTLALLPVERDEVIAELCEVDAFLKTQKGYGTLFGASTQQRLMHAGMLVSIAHGADTKAMSSAAISGTIAMIAAQQAATIAAVAAASSAASAANH